MLVLDSSMVTQRTSQRALLMDGAKKDAVLIVNSTLPPESLLELVNKYALSGEWKGKLVSIQARKYDSDLSIGLIGGLTKAWGSLSADSVISSLESLGMSEKAKAMRQAYDEANVIDAM